MAPAATSSGVFSSSAPMTPTLTPFTLNTTDGVTQSGALPVAVSTMLDGQERELGVRLVGQQAGRRRSRTRGCRTTWRPGPRRSRRRWRGCPGASPSSAATRRRCRRRRGAAPWPRQARQLLVEHRRQLAGPADADVDAVMAIVVGSSWPWKSLSPMMVSGFTRVAALEDVEQDPALALLRLGDARAGRRGSGRGRSTGPSTRPLVDRRRRRPGTWPAC